MDFVVYKDEKSSSLRKRKKSGDDFGKNSLTHDGEIVEEKLGVLLLGNTLQARF